MTMGDIIREQRQKHNMTMEELGNRLGVGKSAVNKWEKGYVQNIKRSVIMKMAAVFECSPAYLMGMEKFDTPADFEIKWYQSGCGKHPIELSEEEHALILSYRCADDTTKEMLNRILRYKELLKERLTHANR